MRLTVIWIMAFVVLVLISCQTSDKDNSKKDNNPESTLYSLEQRDIINNFSFRRVKVNQVEHKISENLLSDLMKLFDDNWEVQNYCKYGQEVQTSFIQNSVFFDLRNEERTIYLNIVRKMPYQNKIWFKKVIIPLDEISILDSEVIAMNGGHCEFYKLELNSKYNKPSFEELFESRIIKSDNKTEEILELELRKSHYIDIELRSEEDAKQLKKILERIKNNSH